MDFLVGNVPQLRNKYKFYVYIVSESLLVIPATDIIHINAGIVHHPCSLPCPSSQDNESRTTHSSGIN